MARDRVAQLCILTLLCALGCIGCKRHAEAPHEQVREETPADAILRVGRRWQVTEQASGFQAPPSRISRFSVQLTSELEFEGDGKQVSERLAATEEFEFQDGGQVRCEASAEVKTAARFGRRLEEIAVELRRPRASLKRRCSGGAPPEPSLTLPPLSARFVLRDDQLVAVEPPLERRVYLPIP